MDREGLRVSGAQVELRGYVSQYARVEIECRADVSAGSMFSAWMIGMEDEPWRCGEICIVEVFGETVTPTSCGIGSGIHAFRDPVLTEEFSVEERALDVAQWHTYAVDWRDDGIDWYVDGTQSRSSRQSPGYPMLVILGIFDFPGRSDPNAVPGLSVRRVRG